MIMLNKRASISFSLKKVHTCCSTIQNKSFTIFFLYERGRKKPTNNGKLKVNQNVVAVGNL